VKLYTGKVPINAADLLNEKVISFFYIHRILLLRMLTERGTEFCGKVYSHDYELFLAINDIDHSKTKDTNPQSNGICERFQKTILDEFYPIAFRKKIYLSLDELQEDLEAWLARYSTHKPHQGRRFQGRTPMETLANIYVRF